MEKSQPGDREKKDVDCDYNREGPDIAFQVGDRQNPGQWLETFQSSKDIL